MVLELHAIQRIHILNFNVCDNSYFPTFGHLQIKLTSSTKFLQVLDFIMVILVPYNPGSEVSFKYFKVYVRFIDV